MSTHTSISYPLILSHTQSLSRIFTRAHTHTHTHTPTHTIFSIIITSSHLHTHTHNHSLTYSHPHTLTPSHCRLILTVAKSRRLIKHYQDKKFNLYDIFSEVVTSHPEKTAIIYVDDKRKWTFADLKKYADDVATFFNSIGVAKGDVVAVFVENCPEHIGE